jgi:hypothetical protein
VRRAGKTLGKTLAQLVNFGGMKYDAALARIMSTKCRTDREQHLVEFAKWLLP